MIVDVISGNSMVIIQASGALLEKRFWMIPGLEVGDFLLFSGLTNLVMPRLYYIKYLI